MLEYEGRVSNGFYIWKVENFQDTANVNSLPIWTSLYGYKLFLRAHLAAKHLGLFVHMMQGDYDDILEWPLTGRITLSILDQSGADVCNHISKTFEVTPDLESFQRPTSPHNCPGFGYAEFAPIEQICVPQYVKNKTLLVKFEFHS